MDFTREPIIETVITPKEGCKLVVRSSKSTGQEEYFVDAVEVVSFGHSFFFRSMERPKSFLVPATDYELLEVREARMVLKNVGVDRAIKIGGGRDGQMRTPREQPAEKTAEVAYSNQEAPQEQNLQPQAAAEKGQEPRLDKKRDRRRQNRRRRGRDNTGEEGSQEGDKDKEGNGNTSGEDGDNSPLAQQIVTTSILTSLLPPPPTLISETIGRYKDNALFKDAFYTKDEPLEQKENTPPHIHLEPSEYSSFEVSTKDEEEIYQSRAQQNDSDEQHSPDSLPTHDFEESPHHTHVDEAPTEPHDY